MKRFHLLRWFWFGLLTLLPVASAQPDLTIRWEAGLLRVGYFSEPGFTYEMEESSNLVDWVGWGVARQGTGEEIVEDPITVAAPARFFRWVRRPVSADRAPTASAMATYLVDTKWQDYQFTSSTRFRWFNQPGNWTYTKTGADTALLVLTYDEDGNDPAVYREEMAMTFLTATSGTLRYSEIMGGVEDLASVQNLNFNFDVAPTPEQMAARLLNKTWEGYHFLSATRFELPGTPPYPGNWSYQKTGLRTGLLVFTYDEDGNDPGVYREEMRLTFTSGSPLYGTYRYSAFVNGVEDPDSIIDNHTFFLF